MCCSVITRREIRDRSIRVMKMSSADPEKWTGDDSATLWMASSCNFGLSELIVTTHPMAS